MKTIYFAWECRVINTNGSTTYGNLAKVTAAVLQGVRVAAVQELKKRGNRLADALVAEDILVTFWHELEE